MEFHIILAHDKFYGIGKDGKIPWKCKEDMTYFKNVTSNSVLMMGRITFESLSVKSLQSITANRKIIVVTSGVNNQEYPNVMYSSSYDNAKVLAYALKEYTKCFVCGGESLYKHAFKDLNVTKLHLTILNSDYNCDTHVSWIIDEINKWKLAFYEHLNDETRLYVYNRISEEKMYLKLLKEVLYTGTEFNDRTGVGIYSCFGRQISFDVSNYFPLLTTKKVFFRGVAEELLWFLRGETDSKILSDKGVNIWKGNTSREYLDSLGFIDREVGDIGPGYGHQWRHWNAHYVGCQNDYSNCGIDQINNCIENIKYEITHKIHNRRNLLISWNPEQVNQASLPPCHVFVQFYTNYETNSVSLHMYQRSADLFLGVPFNIASYSLLLYLVCKSTNTKPEKLVISFGDVHIYKNHFDSVKTQLSRECYNFPKLNIKAVKNIDEYTYDDIQLIGYVSHGKLDGTMAV